MCSVDIKAPRLCEITDLVFRRMRFNLKEDVVKKIYAEYIENNKVRLTIIIGCPMADDELTALAVRYNHTFADSNNTYVIKVLAQPNHFTVTDDTYILWDYVNGFTLLRD